MAATLTTLVSFSGINGEVPKGDLIADSAGDLFGTTSDGGANGAGGINISGTVFEIAKTAGGYATTPTTLVNFNDEDGASPVAGLLADASGDLFGTTEIGGAERLRHGVRDRQDGWRLRQHPDHAGQLQRRQRLPSSERRA